MPRPTEERSCLRCGHAEVEHMHHRRGTDCSHYDLAVHGAVVIRAQCPCLNFETNHIVWWLHRVWWRLRAIVRPSAAK